MGELLPAHHGRCPETSGRTRPPNSPASRASLGHGRCLSQWAAPTCLRSCRQPSAANALHGPRELAPEQSGHHERARLARGRFGSTNLAGRMLYRASSFQALRFDFVRHGSV